MQDCGGCMWFTKWKTDKFGGGLCETNDWRTKSDSGHDCKDFTAKKYNRLQQKRLINKDITLELSEG